MLSPVVLRSPSPCSGSLRYTGDNIASEDEANTLWVFTLEIPSRPALQLGDEKCLNYVGTEGSIALIFRHL